MTTMIERRIGKLEAAAPLKSRQRGRVAVATMLPLGEDGAAVASFVDTLGFAGGYVLWLTAEDFGHHAPTAIGELTPEQERAWSDASYTFPQIVVMIGDDRMAITRFEDEQAEAEFRRSSLDEQSAMFKTGNYLWMRSHDDTA